MKKRRNSLRLGDIAFARSGDKGSSANVAVFARVPETYPFLVRCLTVDVVKRYFQPLGIERVTRFEVPNIDALNFVLTGALGKGGSRSLRIDSQGKTLGQAILELELSETDEC